MKKIKKGYKRVFVSVIFNSKEYGDFIFGKDEGSFYFDIPIKSNCKPFFIYQYEQYKNSEPPSLKHQGVFDHSPYKKNGKHNT